MKTQVGVLKMSEESGWRKEVQSKVLRLSQAIESSPILKLCQVEPPDCQMESSSVTSVE